MSPEEIRHAEISDVVIVSGVFSQLPYSQAAVGKERKSHKSAKQLLRPDTNGSTKGTSA